MRRMCDATFLRRLLVAAVCAVLPAAAAGQSRWQVSPGSCVPDEVNKNLNARTHWAAGADGSVGHLGTETGTIVLRCSMTNPLDGGATPTWNTIEVAFSDSSTAAGNGVQVTLRQVDNSTGAVVSRLLFNSDDHDPTGSGWIYVTEPVAVSWNFSGNSYYLEAQVARTTAAATAKLLFAGLF